MEKETKRCPYCGEVILAVAQKCKHCGEWLNKESNTLQPKEETPKEQRIVTKVNADNSTTSAMKSKNSIIYIVAAIVVVIVIVLVFQFFGEQKTSATFESQDMKETEAPVEAQPEYVYPEDNEEVIEIPGMIQHTEDQGKNIPGDDDPWRN